MSYDGLASRRVLLVKSEFEERDAQGVVFRRTI